MTILEVWLFKNPTNLFSFFSSCFSFCLILFDFFSFFSYFSGRFDTSRSMIVRSVPEISPGVGFCDEEDGRGRGGIGYSSSWIH